MNLTQGQDNQGLQLTLQDGLKEKFEKFRKSNSPSALLTLSIDPELFQVQLEEEINDVKLEDVGEDLPDSTPRARDDGRIQYPLVFIFYTPFTSPPNLSMLYSSGKGSVQRLLSVNKIIELREKEDLSEKFIKSQTQCAVGEYEAIRCYEDEDEGMETNQLPFVSFWEWSAQVKEERSRAAMTCSATIDASIYSPDSRYAQAIYVCAEYLIACKWELLLLSRIRARLKKDFINAGDLENSGFAITISVDQMIN
ncbi:MAG: hypothetical protein EZS28_009072 [Streblomastix strix]|uniref:ADF-H domain-containing protein n=1 Tax=Streblomastix strix TaxID=222440 RepID=A0A5J4WL98_9EUKA|nr:MAG: hypothetical protein EZS28_009072 [Streblomastix strix]